ncbi:hypothetical protein [Veillonella sp. CHU740]|uniref:hypothetical protein n=1 Tax=Veillonella sp. CHU740 TaxID=2490950 RepID=UPI000F8C8835|nr:hypothetical protein [Veillonella sp. CHU740]
MMKVSSVKDLYNRIVTYVRIHGRLVLGTTVLLCLICYLGWRESAWSEVESLRSPIQQAKEEELHEIQTNKKSEKDHDTHKKESKKRGHKDKTTETESQTSLVYPVRNVIRAYPLVDSFASNVPMRDTEEEETFKDYEEVHDINHKGKRKSRREHRKQSSEDNVVVSDTHSDRPIQPSKQVSHIVQLLGIVHGSTPLAVLAIDGTTHIVGVHEVINGVQVVAIESMRVSIKDRGEVRWLE